MLISSLPHNLVLLFSSFSYRSTAEMDWAADCSSIQQTGATALFLLRDLIQETDPGQALSREEIESQLFNPYTTFNPIFDNLPLLQVQGYLFYENSRYTVTSQGRALIEYIEQAARNYLATLSPLPFPELTHLATTLQEIAVRMWQADEPAVKAHQARAQRLPPITTNSPMLHLEAAIFALWMARDDAHIAAWRAQGLNGPRMEQLSRLATGEAETVPALISGLQHMQHPEDVIQGITTFCEAGYALLEGEHLTLTESGRQLRSRIEEETDRIYFTPWPELSFGEMNQLYFSLKTVCDRLE